MIGTFPRGGKADVDSAVAAARRAFVPWRRTSRITPRRTFPAAGQSDSQRYRRTGDVLAQRKRQGARRSPGRSRRRAAHGAIRVRHGPAADRRDGGVRNRGKDLYVRRKPRGVVAVITPWNFPFAVPLWMLGPQPAGGKHGRVQAVGRNARDRRAAGASCSTRPAFRPARSIWSMAWAKRRARRWRAHAGRRRRLLHRQLCRRLANSADWRPRAITKPAPSKPARKAP